MKKKESEKTAFGRLLVCLLAGLLVFGGFVVVTDPFYQYHGPWFGLPVTLDNAVYQTAGAARNLPYDSAIVGTSMTENFHTGWFDRELGWKTMKLSYSGARTDDLKAIFQQVFTKERRNIFMDINAYQLTCDSTTAYVSRPGYLYDKNPFNNYRYVFNHDVFVLGLDRILKAVEGAEDNVDEAYTWEEEELFGREIALNACRDTKEELMRSWEAREGGELVAVQAQDTRQEKLRVCRENLENILPFIEGHEDTEFVIEIPPYSMLYWEQEVLKGELEDTVEIYRYAIETLLSYENVKIYYFQDEEELITNLENYRDPSHHRPEYNRYIFECIRDGRNLLTRENYEGHLTHMYELARDFDYETLWAP